MEQISTRKAYGVALKRLGDASKRVVALDGDTKNSTFSDLFKKAHPDRYIECFIAEQNMVRAFMYDCYSMTKYEMSFFLLSN